MKERLQAATTYVKLFAEVGTPFGALLVLWYCAFNVGDLPSGLTLGDAVYFLIVSSLYAVVFFFCVASLTAAGNLLIRFVGGIAIRPWRFRFVEPIKEYLTHLGYLGRPKDLAIFAFFGAIIIASLSTQGVRTAVLAFLSAIGMAHFVAAFLAVDRDLRTYRTELAKHSNTERGALQVALEERIRNTQRARAISGAAVLIIPLFFGGINESVLSAAMELSHIRERKAVVYVKSELCDVVKDEFPKEFTSVPGGNFCKLEHVTILFRGLGVNTVVASIGKHEKFLPLPTSAIIVKPENVNSVLEPTVSSNDTPSQTKP